jgi:hypothetical protein
MDSTEVPRCVRAQTIILRHPFTALETFIRQGDQIGPIFAHWAIVFSGRFLKITNEKSPGLLFFDWTSYVLFLTKRRVGLNFGRFFRKLIWSPWSGRPARPAHVRCYKVNGTMSSRVFEDWVTGWPDGFAKKIAQNVHTKPNPCIIRFNI